MITTHRGMLLAAVAALLVVSAACGPTSSEVFDDAGQAEHPDDAAIAQFPDAGATVDAGDTCGEELCGDGLDNNCNALIDEACGCEPSASTDCYTGSADTRGVGVCADGVMQCQGQDEITLWGECEGSVLPGVEVCDATGLDEDCDGTVNEDCLCIPGQSIACGSDVGACAAGTQDCVDNALGQCTGMTGPTAEICDDIDNDCDGAVDENLVQNCGSTIGACTQGESVCQAGQWLDCSGGIGPGAESCDLIDNDCDGDIDEDTAIECGSATGACSTGLSYCVAGSYGDCQGGTDSLPETCDDIDNDCDGTTDEGLVSVCGTGQGVCSTGLRTCSAGMYGACAGSTGPNTAGPSESPDHCDGINDDDCDGLVDEGCACIDGDTSQCGMDVGECSFGTQTCSGGAMGPCVGGNGPGLEICNNGLDEDCNGVADDECPGTDPPILTCGGSISTEPLQTISISASGSDPDGGAVTYSWAVTSRPPGSTSEPANPAAATTTFFVDLAGDYELTVTITDDEGDTASCIVNVQAVPSQDLHIELVWDEAWGDADLHLLRPGLSTQSAWYTIGSANNEYDCFYSNPVASWPPNGGAGNASLDIDDTDGFGPENINIADTPSAGTYHIGVAYYCSHSLGPVGTSINPGDGPTGATVRVFCGGVLTDEFAFNLDQTGQFVHVADVTWPGCAGVSVLDEMWTSEIQPIFYASPVHCPVSCTSNSDCTPGEVCSSGGECILD